MSIEIAVLAIIVVAILAAAGTWIIANHLHRRQDQITGLSQRITELEQVAKTEQERRQRIENARPGRRHNAYNTNAALEDALAVAIDIIMNRRVEDARMETLTGILKAAREGPECYDPDRPNGKK